MPFLCVHQANIERLEILNHDGTLDEALMPNLSGEQLVQLMKMMLRMRTFDEKAINLQRQGRMGTFGSLRGQEAAQAGLAFALTDRDWLIPSIREQGILETRGIPMHFYYSFCKGDERASRFLDGKRCLPPSIPVGSQLLHATGIGMGLRLKNERAAAIGFAGDGATSEGDFHEALNFAGVFKAQTLFYIQNNGWAISVPVGKQTASRTLAQKGDAYGVASIQVDGNDVIAVYVACQRALDYVRSGEGPYLIEAVTYRLGSHTTADDASRYRPKGEWEYWEARDPLKRFRTLLKQRKLWDDEQESQFVLAVTDEAELEVARLEAIPQPSPSDIFDSMFEELPWNLREQRMQLLEELAQAE